jgi:hypothetical protein
MNELEKTTASSKEINSLFTKLSKKLTLISKEEGDEVVIPVKTDPKEIRLLFEAVEKNLRAPQTSDSKKIITSSERSLINNRINEQAKLTAQIIKLKEAEDQKKLKLAREERRRRLEAQKMIISASIKDLCIVTIVDLSMVTLLTLLKGVLLLMLFYKKDLNQIINLTSNSDTTILLTGTLSLLFPITIFSYNLILLITRQQTLGMKLAGTVYLTERYRKPRSANLILKALSEPLSILTLSPLLQLAGKRTLAESVASLKMSYYQEAIEV